MKNLPREKVMALFTANAVFAAGVDTPERLPTPFMPEIAFIGRSNVGKSSLVNALTAQKMLARVSNTPGRTQQLNFFRLADRFFLVDMPGYGFAKASKEAIADWNALIDGYLRERTSLKRLCLLIDSRHGIKDNDAEFMQRMGTYGVPFVVILTKTDKIKPTELQKVTEETKAALSDYGAAWPEIFATSAEKNNGIDQLRYFLAESI